ncbi:Histone acetyltransferases subunit 3 [Aspergillus parasiticus SU-1]|uniref:Histone acetyltransferases subunit 3-domain-containing protein n=4 Tax=Aspergillus subgen. Circumdati TaxID=2720871 RepID=A0A5N6JFG5_9EURO|nr:histone acetyltransferases subunit 3-domain-containing protein [Aspergillus parasiticus]KAB8276677.1 histone acetyltransferases subunit 3-domain-containing protein [Aspergillus minisclerotigenes]KAE8319067.1 histone acetyltransferases subunit 3-domain-containing protein [Aspergillus transmontanensis]KJK65163.1 Histone acetyltransferases subunit 3 [Aspergillus parasiticus SU-1]
MPSASKGKGKGREARPSRSRNTTPNSSFSAPTAAPVSSYLDNDVSKLLVPVTAQYGEILDRMGGVGPIPDSKSLETLMEHLKTLSQLAEARSDACDAGIRELSQKRKEVVEEPEHDADRPKMKREADDEEEESKVPKGGKLKKRKERGSSSKEDRPLAHGAHELSRQDGAETKVEGAASPISKKSKSTSSLSPPEPNSPKVKADTEAQAPGSPMSDDSSDSHQPEPAPAVPQIQVFGPNPVKFDDPTIYHIRDVTPDMTDDERKEIYSVTRFPASDLSHMMAGVAPDKDYSNSKPTNQVSANTFLAYVEPYVRPLMEEDIAFLKEKGDRATPFIMPRRGKRHYNEIWAEEDGLMNVDQNGNKERLPLNQGRGNIDQVTDETMETDKVSVGPLVSRLYSLLRYEHRAPDETPGTNGTVNGELPNGSSLGDAMDLDHPIGGGDSESKPQPSATSFPDASPSGFKVPAAKLDHAQLDERLKAELRHVGFLGAEDNPDYDAHYDDDIAQRLRLLQSELKKQMIVNSARKARLLEIARERMAYQEYMTIHDDLDSQVQQAYLKRTRTLGKSKKGSQAKHRPGGAGGGSHVVSAAGVGRPAIGDVARTLMDRRKRWRDCIGPIFKDCKTSVPRNNESVFDPSLMAEYEKAEVEGWDEEQE